MGIVDTDHCKYAK